MSKKKPKRTNKQTGQIDPGKGKVRPHHKEVSKRTRKNLKDNPTLQKNNPSAYTDRYKKQDANYIPRTPNKYQTQPEVVFEDETSKTYQWFEDNGHEDHVQLKKKQVLKGGVDNDGNARGTAMVAATITDPVYQENFKEIFGNRKRGINVKGGYKKFKKTY
jgi:hypothetical protein